MKQLMFATIGMLTVVGCSSSPSKLSPTMVAGDGIGQLQIIASDNRPRTVQLDPTTYHGHISIGGATIFGNTDDALWNMNDPQTGDHSQFQWIDYMVRPGVYYKVRSHCQYDPVANHIQVWLEFQADNGSDNHNDSKMQFTDWQGGSWTGFVQPVPGQTGYPTWSVRPGFVDNP